MGDEGEVKYVYEGERATGETVEVTAGDEPKVLTKPVELLGARQGQGKAVFPSGDVYEGEFAGGARGGAGKYVYAAPAPEEGEEALPPKATYEGKFKAGEKHGVGVMMYASGAKFHGTFAAGKFEGAGTMFYANGDIYTGEWVAGKKHGTGSYIYKESGAKVAGSWEENVLQSGTFTDKYGNEYAGNFAADASAASYVAGGSFSLASGAKTTVPKPSKAELLEMITGFDADGNGVIDAAELGALLTRPGSGVKIDAEMVEMLHMILAQEFDKNADGKLQIAEVAAMLDSQFMGF